MKGKIKSVVLILMLVLACGMLSGCCPPEIGDRSSDKPPRAPLVTTEFDASDGLHVTAFRYRKTEKSVSVYVFLRIVDEEAGVVCWTDWDPDSAPSCLPMDQTDLEVGQ